MNAHLNPLCHPIYKVQLRSLYLGDVSFQVRVLFPFDGIYSFYCLEFESRVCYKLLCLVS